MDIGIEVPINLTHNGVAISAGSVDTATLLVKHGRVPTVREIVLTEPGTSDDFPDQWIATLSEADFTALGVGTFQVEVHLVLNGDLGERTIPTEGQLQLEVIRRFEVEA